MKNAQLVALTGDRPTGRLHLGHFVGSIQNRLELQETHQLFYMIADVQALTDNADNPTKVRNNVLEVALDNLACGMDPSKTTMFIQSQVPEIAELTVFLLNLVTLARLKRNPTVKSEMKQKGYAENVPAGFLVYPVSQAADILTFKATVIPVGADQLPVLEQANELIDDFNRIYHPIFSRIQPVTARVSRLQGIDGKAKMSKSLNNAIFIGDSDKVVSEKVMAMYTDPNHLRVTDPGQTKGNMVFLYLDVFDPDRAGLKELKRNYEKGGVGDVVVKKRLISVLHEILLPIRERRQKISEDPKAVMQILEEGTKRARKIAKGTLQEVRDALSINYFSTELP